MILQRVDRKKPLVREKNTNLYKCLNYINLKNNTIGSFQEPFIAAYGKGTGIC